MKGRQTTEGGQNDDFLVVSVGICLETLELKPIQHYGMLYRFFSNFKSGDRELHLDAMLGLCQNLLLSSM